MIGIEALDNKYSKYKQILYSDSVRGESFKALLDFLENETEFMTAPASNRYHLSIRSGLIIHSLSVTDIMLRLRKIMAPEIPVVSIIATGLLHDCGKENQYLEKEPTDKQKKYGYRATPPYEYRDDIVPMKHETRSLYYVSGFVKLNEEEWGAIAYHNEPWDGQSSAFRKNKLMTILQNADYWSTNYCETESEVSID